ncbi:MAG: YchJ family protein [Burkholderiaceae bacterium]
MKTATAATDAQRLLLPCPCGRALAYGDCCGPLHTGTAAAADAESLMRSRYSAFVFGLAGYLVQTWHPDTRPPRIEPDRLGEKWLGLEVRATRTDGDQAWVEFVARSRTAGRATRLHENSRFVREHGRWLYVDGQAPAKARRGFKPGPAR